MPEPFHHPLPECERAFGRIEANQLNASSRSNELSAQISEIRKEIVKLTGNGNKGRIDTLAEATAVNTVLLKNIAVRFDKLESRQWGLAAKVATLAGTAAMIGTWVVGKF